MKYTKYEYENFRIFAVDTDKFKNCHMEVIFYDNVSDNLCAKSFLTEMLTYTTKAYPTRKEMVIALEELYNASLYGVNSKVGNLFMTNFIYDFLNPEYVNDENYLDNVMSFLFQSIQKPNVKDKQFDYQSFQIIKNSLKGEIESLKENPTNVALRKTLKNLYPESVTSQMILDSVEDLESITPSSLYGTYENMLEGNYCDIYIIGKLDMEVVKKKILKHFKLPVIKTHKFDLYVDNKKQTKLKTLAENSEFVQTNLVCAYQMQPFTDFESNYVLSVFAEILCGGSLNNKLYEYLRNQNSLCYGVRTIYQKYDHTMLIHVGLDEQNSALAIKLIQKAMKEMCTGKFSEEQIEFAKKHLLFSLDMNLDNQNSVINNYVFHNIADIPLLEERKKGIKEVTKQDIMNLSKKIKHIYTYKLMGASKDSKNDGSEN